MLTLLVDRLSRKQTNIYVADTKNKIEEELGLTGFVEDTNNLEGKVRKHLRVPR